MSKVYFIGAGPGDPELITVRGYTVIEQADIILYAGSLVNKEVIAHRKRDAAVYNTASMTLEEVVAVMKTGIAGNRLVARVHTGDPSIYSAVREQIDELEKLSIAYEVIPGVSSFTAAASVLGKEFTVPGVSQTVICTRLEGRTPVPGNEDLELLASHKSSMAVFLSVHMITSVVDKLLKHYATGTPVAVVQKATWPEQKVITGTLGDIVKKVESETITKTAMILVGDFLGDTGERSLLYDGSFSHGYRKGS